VAVRQRGETQERILRAAEALACEVGAGNLSLDAVAAKAGVSKGGLLYHFPSKAKLMAALVEDFLAGIDAAIAAGEATGRPNAAIGAYMNAFLEDCCAGAAPPSGLLAAFAEDPGLLDPVRAHEPDFLARIRANARDPELATLAFLVVQGLRCMALLDVRVLEDRQTVEVIEGLCRRLGLDPPLPIASETAREGAA
jgi:AcrR family transcriptional regulator